MINCIDELIDVVLNGDRNWITFEECKNIMLFLDLKDYVFEFICPGKATLFIKNLTKIFEVINNEG